MRVDQRFRNMIAIFTCAYLFLAPPCLGQGGTPANEPTEAANGAGAEEEGDVPAPAENEEANDADEDKDKHGSAPKESNKPKLVRLSKEDAVWVDPVRNLVVVNGEVCLREGMLEMFACPKQTKEHESIVAVDTKAFVVHAALLAAGAQVGSPVQFNPIYQPASGTKIDILVLWKDKDGKKRKARAQDMIRNVKTRKAMQHSWVFAGSGFWKDEETGERQYFAEGGDLVCVSNFATATLDLPINSSQSNDGLLFEALTENIPPVGTPVRLVLIPRLNQ